MTDARTQSEAEQAARRADVIRHHLDGHSKAEIGRRTGLNRGTVASIVAKYMAGGEAALIPSPRGRRPGSGAALTSDQERQICLLMRKPPRHNKLSTLLWTREKAGQLIANTFGIGLSDRGLAGYLNAWGITSAPESSAEVREWHDAYFSKIHARARQEHIEVYRLHRHVRLDAGLWGRDEASKPWFVSASDTQRKLHWKIVDGAFNPAAQATFIKALVRDTERPSLYLIRDATDIYSSAALADALGDAPVTLFP